MAQQNIYDNATFFEGYRNLREKENNANNLFEIPALLSLLPELDGKKVLDLGCGFGDHCRLFAEMGAEKVIGIDISSKMLDVARKENADPRIEYINMPIESIDKLNGSFDIAVSSLAFHYIEDFSGAVKNVFDRLSEGGIFVFSQEHPLVTCHSRGSRWTKDENGEKLYVNLANYGVEGERETKWFVEGVKIYHRTFSLIINTLTEAGFTVEKMIEPRPSPELLEKHPEHKDLFHKPDFLLIRSRK
ncbi:MAG: class I SAM-dependent methyltransferase [Clostridia bacterium]|nr:class I SAM-dependent methyltransferase [Clostridia bacterium]